LCVLLSYIKDAYGFIICIRESVHSVVLIDKTFKIPIVKSSGYNTIYIVVLISVLCPDGSIYIDGVVLLLSKTRKRRLPTDDVHTSNHVGAVRY
jgi:hypothetical protein